MCRNSRESIVYNRPDETLVHEHCRLVVVGSSLAEVETLDADAWSAGFVYDDEGYICTTQREDRPAPDGTVYYGRVVTSEGVYLVTTRAGFTPDLCYGHIPPILDETLAMKAAQRAVRVLKEVAAAQHAAGVESLRRRVADLQEANKWMLLRACAALAELEELRSRADSVDK